MKETVEAWQMGELEGWDDGYYDFPPKKNFNFPESWSLAEMESFIKGYKDGYEQGSNDC